MCVCACICVYMLVCGWEGVCLCVARRERVCVRVRARMCVRVRLCVCVSAFVQASIRIER